MMPNYRSVARAALERADAELTSLDAARWRYAALELRTAMEALAYERLLLYKDELQEVDLSVWQPKQVFKLLLSLDEYADKSSSLSYGLRPSPGTRPEKMEFLGTDRVMSMKEIKTHYDKIGSFLHAPTVQQFRSGSPDSKEKIRSGCEQVRRIVADILASPVFCVTFSEFCKINCMKCQSLIFCRVPRKAGESRVVKCVKSDCVASYRVEPDGPSDAILTPLGQYLRCRGAGCIEEIMLWQEEIQPGRVWVCEKCKGRNELVLTVKHTSSGSA